MISDTLHEAVTQIDEYLKDGQVYPADLAQRITRLRNEMDDLKKFLDLPPAAPDPHEHIWKKVEAVVEAADKILDADESAPGTANFFVFDEASFVVHYDFNEEGGTRTVEDLAKEAADLAKDRAAQAIVIDYQDLCKGRYDDDFFRDELNRV